MAQYNRTGKKPVTDAGSLLSMLFCGLSVLLTCMFYVSAGVASNIENTKHNLSISGPGTIRSGSETRICIFCHTPHNATPLTPLWNKAIEPQTYSVYQSPTLRTPQPLPQPTGATKLCLSCHDGTIALGTVASGANLGLNTTLTSSSSAYFGLDLSTHHPVSFSYSSSLPYPELADPVTLPPAILLGGGDIIHCNSCHDPHDDSKGMFLVMDNRYSALCQVCHQDPDWSVSGHATSSDLITADIRQMLPANRPIDWLTVADWGCEICHTPHFALATPLLVSSSETYCIECHSDRGPFHAAASDPLLMAEQEQSGAEIHLREMSGTSSESDTGNPRKAACTTCHSEKTGVSADAEPVEIAAVIKGPALEGYSRQGGRADIKGQLNKRSGHHMQPPKAGKNRPQPKGPNNVTCSDCHNPHKVRRQDTTAPHVSGMQRGVSGIDRNGMEVKSANYEYEICFKCHADFSYGQEYVPRVIPNNNLRLAFEPGNPSYHPVMETGKNSNLPSLLLSTDSSASNLIYCTDCHRDDAEVSRGPHGSSHPPILRARYEMNDGTYESYDNFALCYQCHDRTSILRDDSFKRDFSGKGGHRGHLASGASCAVCHAPHGVVDDGTSGSHTHLINFDTRVVTAKSGTTYPFYTDLGTFSGSCTLVCHGKLHDNLSY
ncbi:MAG: cytochrome c3 family protein [Thermodesulfovibrionales bacterium]